MASICLNWSTSEDVQLCISYCRQSVDPISGGRQKINKLWEKIYVDYQVNWIRDEHEVNYVDRTQSALQSRMSKLKPLLVSWGSCVSYARRNSESGCNVQDETRKAQTLFVAKWKKTFNHFECWEHVKGHPTFASVETTTPPTYTHAPDHVVDPVNTNEFPEYADFEEPVFATPESNPGSSSSPIRPPGVKAAKEARRKGKKVASSTNESHNQAMLSIAESQRQYLEQNSIQMEREWKIQQQLLEQTQQKMDRAWKMQQHEFNLKHREEESRIMLMDTEKMTPKSKKFFSKRKADILKSLDEDDHNEVGGSDDFGSCFRPLNFDD